MTLAFALSGGGANGAYEVGVIGHLMGRLGMDPEILTGTSVGALNATMIAQVPMGRPLEAARACFDVWHELQGNESVYVQNNDVVAAVLGSPYALPSVYNTAPLRRLVQDTLSVQALRASGRKLATYAVSLDTGELGVWRHTDEDIGEGVLASAAFPVMFPAVQTRGQSWIDGGVREVLPAELAIELGATRVVAIITEPAQPTTQIRRRWTMLQVALRSLGLLVDEVLRSDLEVAEALADDSGIELHVVRPAEALGDSFDFSRQKNHRLIVQGDADAQRMFG